MANMSIKMHIIIESYAWGALNTCTQCHWLLLYVLTRRNIWVNDATCHEFCTNLIIYFIIPWGEIIDDIKLNKWSQPY